MKRRSKWVKILVSVLLSVVLMVQMTGIVFGAKVELNVPINGQTMDELCCWACCGTSVCQYYGIPASVEQFIFSVKYTYSRSVAGNLTDVQSGLAQKGVASISNASENNYIGQFGYFKVKSEIDANRPMIASSLVYVSEDTIEDDDTFPQVYSHAVLVTGYNSDGHEIQISDSIGQFSEYYSDFDWPSPNNPYYIVEGYLYQVEVDVDLMSMEAKYEENR